MDDGKRTQSPLPALVFSGLLSLLVSCGGTSVDGGGIGGTGKTTTLDDEGLILGKVSGFGSIVINNQRFDTQNAEFLVDGKEAVITDIQIGMNIGAQVNFTTKLASQVFYQPLVAGPIESTENTLSILGQSILITPSTVLDGLTADALQPGLIIEVSGDRDSNQSIVADYVTIAAADTSNYTVGVINQITPDNHTALLSGTVINYLPAISARLHNPGTPLDSIRPGNQVRVEVPNLPTTAISSGDTTDTSPSTKADEELMVADVQSVQQFGYTDGSRVEIAGRINTFSSDGAFIVSGVTVYTDVTTEVFSKFGILIENPVLKNNEAVILQGTAIGTRRITAQKITLTDRL